MASYASSTTSCALVSDIRSMQSQKCDLSNRATTLYWLRPLPPHCKTHSAVRVYWEPWTQCLKNRLNDNNNYRYSESLDDWSDAFPEAVVDRRWLDEVIPSRTDWRHCLNGRWLDGQRLKGQQLDGWRLDWRWLNEVLWDIGRYAGKMWQRWR